MGIGIVFGGRSMPRNGFFFRFFKNFQIGFQVADIVYLLTGRVQEFFLDILAIVSCHLFS